VHEQSLLPQDQLEDTPPIDSHSHSQSVDIGNGCRREETEGADSIDKEIEKDITEYQKQKQADRMYIQANDSEADPANSSRLKGHARRGRNQEESQNSKRAESQ
jgi:hypothetical protein